MNTERNRQATCHVTGSGSLLDGGEALQALDEIAFSLRNADRGGLPHLGFTRWDDHRVVRLRTFISDTTQHTHSAATHLTQHTHSAATHLTQHTHSAATHLSQHTHSAATHLSA